MALDRNFLYPEILTRLHDVMASRTPAQAKLNQVVEIIGEALDSEVCSIYLLRDGVLELFATRGLKQEAVHVTKLGVGEGLVGTIAAEYRDAEPRRSGQPSRVRLQARNRRGEVPLLRRRADRPPRARGRRAHASSTPIRAATTKSRSRRCRPWRWCWPS